MILALAATAAAAQAGAGYPPRMSADAQVKMSVLTDLAGRVVAASKSSDERAMRQLSASGATFVRPRHRAVPLSAASFHHEASACSPAFGVDPETKDGLLVLTKEMVRVIWNCPTHDRSSGTETILLFKDGKLVSARTQPGGFIATMVPPHG